MNSLNKTLIVLIGCGFLTACGRQHTPSLMNTDRPELLQETHLEQIPLDKVDEMSMAILADQYTRYGMGPLELTMAYDPKSKAYTAMKAVRQLKEVSAMLAKKGVTSVKTDTLPVSGETPVLMVMYPMTTAQAPSNCGTMPGLEEYTTEPLSDETQNYRFGCGIESMLARQIYRPSDLQGTDGSVMGVNEGRRLTNVIDTYQRLNDKQAAGELDRERTVERDGLESN